MPSERTFTRRDTGQSFTKFGSWRNGIAEADTLSAFYADVDNNDHCHPLVTTHDVATALNAHGLRFFIYTSFRDTKAKPKFWVVIDTTRNFTRNEMLRVAVFLNWTAFGKQADLSIYDPGDFVFAPPFHCTTIEHLQGVPLDLDAVLARQEVLQAEHPESWSPYIRQKQPKPARTQPTAAQVLVMKQRQSDRSARPEIGIENPAVFHPLWQTLYEQRVVGDSHWETMRSLLGMVWAKNRGALSYGEMEHIFRQIDETRDGYFLQEHGPQKAVQLIDWIMDLPVDADDQESWHPLLDQDETGLTVLAKEGECGEGKTHDELKRIAREKGRYVWVVDKIDTIEKRRQEFFQIAGKLDAVRFLIKEAHSQKHELRVALQLHGIRQDLNKEPAGRPAIVFVTQAGAMQMDWSRWGDCEVIFDEVPDCFSVYKINVKNHFDVLQQYVHPVEKDGKCYRLGLSKAGEDLARSTDIDDYDSVHHGLTVMMAKPNTLVWVKCKAWDDPDEGGRLEFFAITSPLNLKPFSKVWMLGDELTKSVTAKAWTGKWAVTFEKVEFERRKRLVPTKHRVTIFYFSDHRDSSLTRFREGDMPLEETSDWIRRHAGNARVLWTTNEKFKAKSKLDIQDYISPKAHGRNDLQHHTHVAWLAAMKASKFEIGTLKEVCGMTAQELTDWREFNAMYQFVMRCILRDFASAEPVVVYVFSRRQAEYLRERLGGAIQNVPGVVIDKAVRCIDEEGPMSDAERSKVMYWRKKMVKAGATDVCALPKAATKLSDREIRLVNATFEKLNGGVEQERLAA